MIVAIHQPNFFPWLGFFYKIYLSDVFVLLDDVQFTKNSYINRSKIIVQGQEKWLTCPVITSGEFGQKINEVSYFKPQKLTSIIKGTIQANYGKSKFYKEYAPQIYSEFRYESLSLAQQNKVLIEKIIEILGIKVEILCSSVMDDIEGTSTKRLVSICKRLSADTYIGGFGSVNYQEDELFLDEKIQFIRSNFSHPVYNQNTTKFITGLSILDALFSIGSEAILEYFDQMSNK